MTAFRHGRKPPRVPPAELEHYMQPSRTHSFDISMPPPAYSRLPAPLPGVVRQGPIASAWRLPRLLVGRADELVRPAAAARDGRAADVLPMYTATAVRAVAPFASAFETAKGNMQRRLPLGVKVAVAAFASGAMVGAGFTTGASTGVRITAGIVGAAVGAVAAYTFAAKGDRLRSLFTQK